MFSDFSYSLYYEQSFTIPLRIPNAIYWPCLLQEGRTPLHYAAALQGTTGGANRLFNLLMEAGADESIVDVVRCTTQDRLRIMELATTVRFVNSCCFPMAARPIGSFLPRPPAGHPPSNRSEPQTASHGHTPDQGRPRLSH